MNPRTKMLKEIYRLEKMNSDTKKYLAQTKNHRNESTKTKGLTKEEKAKKIDTLTTKYPGMTYERRIEIAIQWMLGEASDEDIEQNL
jgi:hypothetical protein